MRHFFLKITPSYYAYEDMKYRSSICSISRVESANTNSGHIYELKKCQKSRVSYNRCGLAVTAWMFEWAYCWQLLLMI